MIVFKILLIILVAAPAIALAFLLLSNLSGIVRKQNALDRSRDGSAAGKRPKRRRSAKKSKSAKAGKAGRKR